MRYLDKINTTAYFHRLPALRILFIFFTAFFSSCNRSPQGSSSNKSYDKVLDSASYIYDSHKFQAALHYLDSATAQYNDLDLLQKFEYYAFHYNYVHHEKGDNDGAMLYADTLLNLFDTPEKKMKYMAKYGHAHFFKGDVLFSMKRYNEAYQYYYQGKLIANKTLDECTLSDFSYRMGMISYKQEHFAQAAEVFKSGLKETQSCYLTFRSFYRRQELISNIALSYSKINKDDSAMFYYKKALTFINTNTQKFKLRVDQFDVARAVIYGNMANLYIKNNKYSFAKRLLEQSSSINLRKGNDNRDAQLSQLKLAHIYDTLGQVDSLGYILQNIRRQLDSVKNVDAEADWNLLTARYLIKQHKESAAVNYLFAYNALKDSIIRANNGLKEADINEQIKRLEKQYEFDGLKKNNEMQDIYLRVASVFAAMLLVILLLILLTWQRSKANIKKLAGLNHEINDKNHQLEHALEGLTISNQEKDRILHSVAHDLRNPIGGIASLTNAMDEDDFNEEQMEMIRLIKETSYNSLELINEILEATGNSPAELKKELVDINALVSNCIELLRFKAAEKHQQILIELLATPDELLISREKIWRVIINLVINAMKFSPAGTDIFVKLSDHGQEIEIAVKDNGIGIPDELKPRVFNSFTDARRPGTAGEKSFGLGLSICKQIIEGHDGRIWFESNGEGTTFFIRLKKPATALSTAL